MHQKVSHREDLINMRMKVSFFALIFLTLRNLSLSNALKRIEVELYLNFPINMQGFAYGN